MHKIFIYPNASELLYTHANLRKIMKVSHSYNVFYCYCFVPKIHKSK